MWADPKISSSQIAREMGFIGRNAVIGRVHRLGLPMRNPSCGNTFRQRAPRKKALPPPPIKSLNHSFDNLSVRSAKSIAPIALPRLDVADTDIPVAQRRDIFSLTDDSCRWPVGDPATPDFFFCGGNAIDGQPYCPHHAKRAFSGQG